MDERFYGLQASVLRGFYAQPDPSPCDEVRLFYLLEDIANEENQ